MDERLRALTARRDVAKAAADAAEARYRHARAVAVAAQLAVDNRQRELGGQLSIYDALAEGLVSEGGEPPCES